MSAAAASERPPYHAGILFCLGGSKLLPFRLDGGIIPKKSGLLTEISRRDFSAADLSGLSLPDAHYEHTSIRARRENLTKTVVKSGMPPARYLQIK